MLISYVNDFYNLSLHRRLLDEKIKLFSELVKGEVLDVGSKNRRYDNFFGNIKRITAIDIRPQKGKDIITADVLYLPFKDASFDTVISFEVLEYVANTEKALDEIGRILKNKGLLIFSVPFLDPVHGDIDSVRYTLKEWEKLIKRNFLFEKTIILGGRYSLVWDFLFEKIRNNFHFIFRLILFPSLVLFRKIAVFMDNREKNWRYPMGYFFVCARQKR